MQRSPRILPIGVILVAALFLGSCAGAEDSEATRARDASGDIPTFTVDPSWPLEMPDKWIMGAVTAVFVDAQDHVWVTHLPETLTPEEISAVQDPPLGTCCVLGSKISWACRTEPPVENSYPSPTGAP